MNDYPTGAPASTDIPASTFLACQRALLDWYARHRRALPWRDVGDPYAVVVSEFMLQQTQVDRVIPKYTAFLRRFPGFRELAAAPVGEVIREWAGLGYNRRAVHLHRLAQQVVVEHGGYLPDDPEKLRRLPGVGPYTVGAILAFAFGRDEPALDTNVRRVLGRIFFVHDPSDGELRRIARDAVPRGRAADWNQALMDLGSTICTARSPRCLLCPVRSFCRSANQVRPVQGRHQGKFHGSKRYYRGRLVAALREEPAGYAVDLNVLQSRLAERGIEPPGGDWRSIAEELARDGLVALEDEGGAIKLALP